MRIATTPFTTKYQSQDLPRTVSVPGTGPAIAAAL